MAASCWPAFEAKMREAKCSDAAIGAFKANYDQLVAGATGLVPEADIEPVTDLPRLESLPPANGNLQALLSATAVLKLNGGLGTSMGLEKAKSLLEVKDGKTFLDLIAEQVKVMRSAHGCAVKFVLMNSFSTSADTRAFLAKAHADLLDEPYVELMQNMSPKVDAASLAPASYPEDPHLEWCPPGHGDIYPSLLGSGMLDRLLADGVTTLFVSNSDNLGATLDPQLLAWFAGSGTAFAMEVCERTAADKKGGHLARRKADGKLLLRESAMCPDADKGAFEDVGLHRYFNTNNLWVNLPMLKATLDAAGGVLPLPLIKNSKTINPRDAGSAKVFQLETAMGSAIECFASAGAVVVPRSRFAPVKTTADLFVLRSDAYAITPAATVEATVPAVPLVKLDDKHYKLVDQMERLTPVPPSLRGARSLTVKGPVRFGAGVVIRGDVTLECAEGAPVTVSGATYDGGAHRVDAPAEAPAEAPALQPALASAAALAGISASRRGRPSGPAQVSSSSSSTTTMLFLQQSGRPALMLGAAGSGGARRAGGTGDTGGLRTAAFALACLVLGFLLGCHRAPEPYPLEMEAFLPPTEGLAQRERAPRGEAPAAPPRLAGGGTEAPQLPLPDDFARAFLTQSGLLAARPPVPAGASGDAFYTVAPHQARAELVPPRRALPQLHRRRDRAPRHRPRRASPRALHARGRRRRRPGRAGEGVRTSAGVFLASRDDPSGALAAIEERIAAVTFIPPSHGEDFNVLRYAPGQHYAPHMDTFDAPARDGFGQRAATVVLYLNDVPDGGETVFKREGRYGAARGANGGADVPSCDGGDFAYRPRAGDALLFFSLNPDLSVNPRALHGACPARRAPPAARAAVPGRRAARARPAAGAAAPAHAPGTRPRRRPRGEDGPRCRSARCHAQARRAPPAARAAVPGRRAARARARGRRRSSGARARHAPAPSPAWRGRPPLPLGALPRAGPPGTAGGARRRAGPPRRARAGPRPAPQLRRTRPARARAVARVERTACMLDALDRQLSAAEQRACRGQDPEGLLTFAEATAALASLPRGAAPGSDGLTCEAYAALWEVLGEPLVQALNYHYLNQAAGAPQLAATQRLGLITLIHKGGQPREAVSSYRPITLLNTDTKIAAKAIVQRLAPALGSIVDGTQTAFVPGRDIADNVLMHLEAIDHARETRAPGCLLFLDFAKAYDRLDRGWLFRCLARMGLPDATTRWVRLLLAGTRARVAFNGGHVSREFSVASGCAQGSPLSPLLYVLAAQPLAAMCRRVQRQPGFASLRLPGGAGPAPCCHQHADDTTLHAASVESAKRLLDGAVAPFCLASGAQLNLAKCKGMLLGNHPALQLQPDGSGQLVECSTGVCFPDTEQAPIRHLGVLLSATGVERHAAQLYRERLRTITCRIAHWSRYALTRPGRRHVARQVLAACVGWHAQFVPVPADLLRLIQRRVTAYIVGNWCIRESGNRIIRQVPRAAIACLPASMGGEAQVDVAAFTTAMLAKTAARLLHPVGAAWKPPAAARFARALPGRGTAALVQGTALELRAQLPWRWGAIACAFAALGVHRVIPHGSMTVEQIRVEALVGNCSVGAALGGARIASLEDLPAELRSDSLGQAAPRLPWRPAADGVVMPGEWQQALARSGPSAPGWQALRPSAAPPSPGGGVVQQPQQPLAALPVEQPPQPPPPPPAVRKSRPPRRHVMERVGPAAAAAAAARREEQEQRREQQLEQRRTLVQEPAANDLVDRSLQARMPRALRHFGWSLLHGGVRVSGDRVFSYQRAAPELAELACPHPLCRAQQQPPLETLGHVLGGCPVAAAVLQWFAHLWARLQPGFPRAPPPPRVMLADDFARSGVAPELQQL
ncbi:hypothetical protein HT031_004825 [Scenedesmus sp. PABB004]|nr:hypothetical protein HT031_004825 [Scenedesmus sp. PABB004]